MCGRNGLNVDAHGHLFRKDYVRHYRAPCSTNEPLQSCKMYEFISDFQVQGIWF